MPVDERALAAKIRKEGKKSGRRRSTFVAVKQAGMPVDERDKAVVQTRRSTFVPVKQAGQ
jgi:hypothetical protein